VILHHPIGRALTGPTDHRHITQTLDRITGISAATVPDVHPPPHPLDADMLMATPLRWAADDFPWLRAEHDGQPVFLRLNTAFPDEPAYSLLIDDGVTVELDDLPACWDRGPLWANRR